MPTPLIGRQREVDELIHLLHDPQCYLLTLVGPGGIGKTRLAIEVASQYQDFFPDGVCFVSLASLDSPSFLVPAIADALGFQFQGQIEPRIQLLNHLCTKQELLVLDNVEHLLGGVGLFAEILERAPGVKLLVTSRERLFLAQIGMTSGPKFLETAQQMGPLFLGLGAAIVLVSVLFNLLVGHFFFRFRIDDLLGITCSVAANPAHAVFASKLVATDRSDISYAITFPTGTIMKILLLQVMLSLMG